MKKSNNNILDHKSRLFLIILSLGITQILLILIGFKKVMPVFFHKFPAFTDSLLHGNFNHRPEFYLLSLAGLLIIAASVKTIGALIEVGIILLKSIFQQNKYLRKSRNGINLIDSDSPLSFTAGLIRPKIYISRSMLQQLNASERRAVIRHEKFHQQQLDPLKILVVKFIGRMHLFPLTDVLVNAYRVLTELAADQHALIKSGSGIPLLSALYKSLRFSSKENLATARFADNISRVKILTGDEQLNLVKPHALATVSLTVSFGLIAIMMMTNLAYLCLISF